MTYTQKNRTPPIIGVRLTGALLAVIGFIIIFGISPSQFSDLIVGVACIVLGYFGVRGRLIIIFFWPIIGIYFIVFVFSLMLSKHSNSSVLDTWVGQIIYLVIGLSYLFASLQCVINRKYLKWF